MDKCEKKTYYARLRRVFPYLGTKHKVSGAMKRIIFTLQLVAHYYLKE